MGAERKETPDPGTAAKDGRRIVRAYVAEYRTEGEIVPAGRTPSFPVPSDYVLPNDWRWVTLASVCDGIFDCPHSTPVLTSDGPLLVRTQDILSGVLDTQGAARVSEETYQERVQRAEPRFRDLLYSREGTYFGIAADVPKETRLCLGQRMVLIRPARDVCHSYLRIWLNSPLMQAYIVGFKDGTVAERLNLPVIRALPAALPPLPEQERIAGLIACFDDKIALNRQINQTLEAMAQALFQSWFVDFDPVKAKVSARREGRDPLRAAMTAISGKADVDLDALPTDQCERLAATAALFPDEMQESGLGEIPGGWQRLTAQDVSEVAIGKTPPRKEPQWFSEGEGDWRWVSIKDMGTSGLYVQHSSEYLTSEGVSRFNVRVVPDQTVILSFKMTIGRVAITDGPMVTNEAIAHFVLDPGVGLSSEYLYLYLKGFDYSTLGSTSSIADAVNSKTIRGLPIVVANRELLDRFAESVRPLFTEIRNRQSESRLLEITRDALLPKLLSGEVEVPTWST